MNCWESKKCGREGGGKNVKELGVCPAFPDGGKKCAEVVGTLCGNIVGTNALRQADCTKCNFFTSEHYEGKRDLMETK